MIHYVTNGDLKRGVTLCGIQVRPALGIIATAPTQIHYVTCPTCLAKLRSKKV